MIDSQPQPFIIDNYLEKILSPISEGEFNRLAKLMEEINMLMDEINIISELETLHVELKIYPLSSEKPSQVISLMDTGAAVSILNPDIIPVDH